MQQLLVTCLQDELAKVYVRFKKIEKITDIYEETGLNKKNI